ncbi:hypothetical protein ABEX53_29950 [Bacillus toyonensis]|uniref:hypothetical protein n=1 Tax=Bacillus toyonensis TaxID=155322 RepID=UPI000CD8CEF7|nr:hypothetical protein [Bacillus toyonensis]MED3541864.1 hypothetical protein [Bacillus toyonensis]MEE2018830.1 hypothetical protein [Bacillus toyonensis]
MGVISLQAKYILFIQILIGIMIIFAPHIITGQIYDVSKVMGDLLVAEIIIRTLSLIIGLVVISKAFEKYSK